jgi:hypothetical protein
MNEVIYKGIYLSSLKSKYFYVTEGTTTSLIDDINSSVLKLTYIPGQKSKEMSKLLGLCHLGEDLEMSPMSSALKFPNVILSLNGLKLKKLTYDPHIVRIVIVSDHESRVSQSYDHTTIVVSEEDYKNPDFVDLVFFSENLTYLKPISPKKCFISGKWEFRNYPKIVIYNSNVELDSESQRVYHLRGNYDQYLIRAIDYEDQFLDEIGHILNEYGVELCRYNREKTLQSTSYISYRINQTPSRTSHNFSNDGFEDIISYRIPIEFELRTTNMHLFFDFKTKYSNVNLLTNLCEFKTTDRYGDRWSAAVKWGRISEDFNHMYESDNNSNFSYQCQFTCELYFQEVYDKSLSFIKEIITDLEYIDDLNINNN